ncbi:MAG: S-layer homology domain-containing protein, partial [Oscillospiraceae bacterium]|nr:S-layer homology domain-containing protein [Oscillospiraceae bacterium]
MVQPDETDMTQPGNYATVNTTGFKDVEANQYYTAAVNWAVGAGIIKGKMIGMQQCLAPTSPATRAEVAVMLERFATYLKKMP